MSQHLQIDPALCVSFYVHADVSKAIVKDFNGMNHRELSTKYNLPLEVVYQLIAWNHQDNQLSRKNTIQPAINNINEVNKPAASPVDNGEAESGTNIYGKGPISPNSTANRPIPWFRIGLVLLLTSSALHIGVACLSGWSDCLPLGGLRAIYIAANAITISAMLCMLPPLKKA